MSVASNITLPKLKLSSKKVISAQIYEFLRKQITETHIKPGILLSENTLSSHFKVSRQPVREALMRLSYEGLVSVLPQRGSIVEPISVSELKQTTFIRAAIEKECVLSILQLDGRTKRACLNQLERVLEQQKNCKTDDSDDFRANYLSLDDAFHEKLCSLSQSPMAWETIQNIKGQMDRIRFLTFTSVSPIDVLTKEHENILESLINQDIKACLTLLQEHLYTINETYKSVSQEYSEWFSDHND